MKPFGPGNSSFVALSRDSVRLCEADAMKKTRKGKGPKLWEVFRTEPRWLEIEHRNDENFWNGSSGSGSNDGGINSDLSQGPDIEPLFLPIEGHATRCAGCGDEEELERLFGWENLDLASRPRHYQVAAYLECLIRDLLVILPTGFGKTLIATMIICKLKVLNPSRMGLFVVDRVPLVFQQGAYISHQTRGLLRVCTLCGENRRPIHIRRLREGAYDVLVVTAGALLEMIQRQHLDISSQFSCVVFDECHHASGNHVYAQLLEHLNLNGLTNCISTVNSKENSRKNIRPRLIGLTASPVAASTFVTGEKRLQELCDRFGPQVTVFSPDNVFCEVSTRVQQVEVNRTSFQRKYAAWIVSRLEQFRRGANGSLNGVLPSRDMELPEWLPEWQVTDDGVFDEFLSPSRLGQVRGMIHSLQEYVENNVLLPDSTTREKISALNLCFGIMLALVGALEAVDILGVKFGARIISEVVQNDRDKILERKGSPAYLGDAFSALEREVKKNNTYEAANNVSPRLRLLHRELRKVVSQQKKNSRVLVLVHTRAVARALKQHLNETDDLRESFRPEMVVGHGGFDGMAWEGEQEVALQKFRLASGGNGDFCRLLIATSVLEEGLDVAECDLVIQLQGVKSLISFIQSRGRARKEAESRMLVFCSNNDFSRLTKVRDEEVMMRLIVQQKSTRIEPLKNIELALQRRFNGRTSSNKTCQLPKETNSGRFVRHVPISEEANILFTVWVLYGGTPLEKEEFEEQLQNSLNFCGLSSLHVVNIAAVSHNCMLPIFEDATGYMVGLSCDTATISISTFNDKWNYEVNGKLVWVEHHSKLTPHDHSAHRSDQAYTLSRDQIEDLSFGHWLDPNTFQKIVPSCLHLESFSVLSVEFKGEKGLWISLEQINGKKIAIEIPPIFDFCLLDFCTKNQLARLFFPLRSSLLVYVFQQGSWIRETNIDNLPFLGKIGSISVFNMSFTADISVIQQLQTDQLAKKIYYTKVKITSSCKAFNEFQFSISSDSYKTVDPHQYLLPIFIIDQGETRDIHWLLLCLFSQRLGCFTDDVKRRIWNWVVDVLDNILLGNLNPVLGLPQPIELISVFYALNECMGIPYWANVERRLISAFEAVALSKSNPVMLQRVGYGRMTASPDKNTFKLYRIVSTPTRIIYLPPVQVGGSRLFRSFGSERFISVAFRDEQCQRLYGKQLVDYVETQVCQGITVAGRRVVFFGASSSQLRQQNLLFVDVDSLPPPPSPSGELDSEIDSVQCRLEIFREGILRAAAITPARFLSRLALFCTSDTPTMYVNEEDVVIHRDVLSLRGKTVLTDGAGALSRSIANKVAHAMRISEVPAAFQIRWRGVKGVVVVVNDDSQLLKKIGAGQGYASMMIRPSMKKYEAGEEDCGQLCIVKHSKVLHLHLNKEIINLLSSIEPNIFDPYSALLACMEQALEDKGDIFIDVDKGFGALSGHLEGCTHRFFKSAFPHLNLLQHPLWDQRYQQPFK